jgi:hypothetical protein
LCSNRLLAIFLPAEQSIQSMKDGLYCAQHIGLRFSQRRQPISRESLLQVPDVMSAQSNVVGEIARTFAMNLADFVEPVFNPASCRSICSRSSDNSSSSVIKAPFSFMEPPDPKGGFARVAEMLFPPYYNEMNPSGLPALAVKAFVTVS